MADAFRPLTLLLGAVCLWALSVLVMALLGLGGNFPAPHDAAKAPALPNISLTRSHSRLGPIADYREVGDRPLLNANRRPAPQMAVDGEAGSGDLDVTLTSVLLTPNLQLAILTDNKDASTRRVRVGETVQGSNWRLVALQPRSAVVEGPSGQRNLELRVFDGKGGQPPTPVSAGPVNAGGDGTAGVGPGAPLLPPPPSAASPLPSRAAPAPTKPQVNAQADAQAPLTQEQQVEAIRRRIEARRAQMRAEAEAAGANEK